MNIWHDIREERITPEDFMGVIEISKGSRVKYELDKETGFLRVDRVIYSSSHYPANYGFIPRTFSCDGDPLDVLVLCSEEIRPMTLVRCYPIGVIIMEDQGERDEKIIAIPFDDPTYNGFQDLKELMPHTMVEISNFFEYYKTLEKKETLLRSTGGREEALEVIREARRCYEEKRSRGELG